MNGVCTNIIHLDQKTLKHYGGNYDAFIKTKAELEENQEKRYQWEQDQIAHMKVTFYSQLTRCKCELIILKYNCHKHSIFQIVSYFLFRTILLDSVMAAQNWPVKRSLKKKHSPKW